jgi:Family of unknown function (DUF6492)
MPRRIFQTALHKTRHLIYLLWSSFFSFKWKPNKDITVDIVIPAIESDLDVLPLCIEGLRKNVSHRIGGIYLVSPESKLIREFAEKNGLIFTEETTVMGYTPASINYIINDGLNRCGWIFQQLIKLSGRVGASQYFLVVDADHILLQPHIFITAENKTIFYQSSEYNIPYYRSIKKLLGFYPLSFFSYVSHKMLFDKEGLKKLHGAIEANSSEKTGWDKIIISQLDRNERAGFSEFELYGNFADKKKKVLAPWKDKMLKRDRLCSYETLQHSWSKYDSITFPYYLNRDV